MDVNERTICSVMCSNNNKSVPLRAVNGLGHGCQMLLSNVMTLLLITVVVFSTKEKVSKHLLWTLLLHRLIRIDSLVLDFLLSVMRTHCERVMRYMRLSDALDDNDNGLVVHVNSFMESLDIVHNGFNVLSMILGDCNGVCEYLENPPCVCCYCGCATAEHPNASSEQQPTPLSSSSTTEDTSDIFRYMDYIIPLHLLAFQTQGTKKCFFYRPNEKRNLIFMVCKL